MIPALPITGAAVLAPEPGGAQRITRIEPPARFSKAVLRRTSRLGQLALPVVEAALLQAESTAGPELGLVVGTGLADLDETIGFLQGVHERGERFASPQMFQRSVHSAVAGELAILYHLTGYNLTVTQGLASGEAALLAAALAVASDLGRESQAGAGYYEAQGSWTATMASRSKPPAPWLPGSQ